MAYSINKVTLVGNVGNDPEVRSLQSGNKVVNLSLATSERWKDKETGEMKSNTEWHKVVIFNAALADIAEKYIKKGAKIYVEGQISTRKWKDEQSGQDKYSTEIIIQGYNSSLTMLGGGGGIQNDPSSKSISKKTDDITVLMVLDANTGQNAINQVKDFNSAIQ